MKPLAITLCLAATLIPVRPDRHAPPPDDLQMLQGTWEVVEFVTPENKLDKETLKNFAKLIIKGNVYRWTTGGSGTIKLDPSRTPKAVDFGPVNGEGPSHLGIYEVNGDTFRDCIAAPGQGRPNSFETPQGSGFTYQVYRRIGPPQ
jgi:uncharacterized protein (TIGR03067 family)